MQKSPLFQWGFSIFLRREKQVGYFERIESGLSLYGSYLCRFLVFGIDIRRLHEF